MIFVWYCQSKQDTNYDPNESRGKYKEESISLLARRLFETEKTEWQTTPNEKEENYVTFLCVSFIDHHTTMEAEKCV